MLYKAQLSMLVHKQYISMTMLDNLCLLLKSPTSVVRVSDRHFSRGNYNAAHRRLASESDGVCVGVSSSGES